MEWNTVERAIKTEADTRTEQKVWASSAGLCQRHKLQHSYHVKMSPWGNTLTSPHRAKTVTLNKVRIVFAEWSSLVAYLTPKLIMRPKHGRIKSCNVRYTINSLYLSCWPLLCLLSFFSFFADTGTVNFLCLLSLFSPWISSHYTWL